MADLSPAERPAVAFGMRWGIKRSFIDYVRRTPDGKAWLGDGAVPVNGHEILFAPGQAEPNLAAAGSAPGSLAFRGEARFSAHYGMLFVSLAAPVLTISDSAADLTVEVPSADSEKAERVPMATLRLEPQPAPDGIALWVGLNVRLTEAGAGLFDDVYQQGEELDPLTVTLPRPAASE